ncbi:MAG: hypothetical protein ACYCOX_03850 [Acidobacteriaceae bacterium]
MLKYLAIFAVFIPLATVGVLASQNAHIRTPEHGIAKTSRGQDGSGQRKPQDSKQSAPNAPPTTHQPPAPTCNEACQQARQNLKIQRELAIFTGLLVFVGFLQVGTMIWQALLLKQTREDIHTQADWMETQTGHISRQADMAQRQARLISRQVSQMENQTEILGDSVSASQKSAAAADMSAKAAMGVAVPTLMLYGFAFASKPGCTANDFFTHPGVILVAKNFGQSPAFLKGYTITFTCEDLPDEPVYSFPYPCNAEAVVDSRRTFLPEKDTLTLDKPMSDSDVLALVSGQKRLTVYGYISYGDIFGSPIRYMKFSKRLMEFDPDPKNMLVMDHGGYKYTGQQENYDPPKKAN